MWCREIPLTIACSQTGFYSEQEVYWSTSLSVPEIAGIKLPHLECMDVQYQQSFCCLKSFFLYGLVNTDLVTHTHPPPYSVRDTKQYRPRAIDPDRSQIWAGDRLVLLPKQLKPRRDLRWFVFAGRGININSGKRKSSLRRHSESTGAKSHTDVLS